MNADRLAALELLLQSADRPVDISRGMRCRILQAASQANSRRSRLRQHLAVTAVCMGFIGGLFLGVTLLVRLAPPMPLLSNWNSEYRVETTAWSTTAAPASPTVGIAAGQRVAPLTAGVMVPVEWRLVDTVSASRESRSRAFGAGLWE
jgi:hypothetical protein